MSASINSSIPETQPYPSSIHTWNESVSSQFIADNPNIVDWVIVELRNETDTNSKVSSRAGFLLNNGSIVDLDGTSALKFINLSEGNYYIVVFDSAGYEHF